MTLATQILTDLDVFIDTSEFGTAATYTPNGGDATAIEGIFNESTVVIDPYKGDVEEVVPTYLTKTSNVSSAAHKDSLIIGSDEYEIIKVNPDNGGMTMLYLNKVN